MTFYILIQALFIFSCLSLNSEHDLVDNSQATPSIIALNDFSMVKSRTSWRNKFYVYVGNTSELLYHLETYCPNWENQGPEGILSETGSEFLQSSWTSFTATMTVKYDGLTRYIYYPSAGSWKGYFGSAFLLDANESIIAYVPWKWSLYKFQVVSQNGNALANAERDYFGNPVWYIKFTGQNKNSTTIITAVDVAVMTFLYEFTRDTSTLSDGVDGCTNFLLLWVPVIVGIVLAIFFFCIFYLYCRHRCCGDHTKEELIPLKDAGSSRPLSATESNQVTDMARKLGLFSRPGYDNV